MEAKYVASLAQQDMKLSGPLHIEHTFVTNIVLSRTLVTFIYIKASIAASHVNIN